VFSANNNFPKTHDSKISFTAESIQMAVGKTYEFQSDQTFIFTDITANGACEGSIDITGSSSDPAIFQANTGVTEITVSSVNLLNVNADPEDVFIAKESVDLGGTDGWTFEDEPDGDDLYWIGGTGDWDDPDHWATTSGALVADGCVPTVKDNVYFDDGSFDDTEQTVYTGASDVRCRTMDWTGSEAARPNFEMGDTDITGVYIYGSLYLNSTVNVDLSAMVDFYFRATEEQEIETFGYLFPNNVEFDGSDGEWTLQDSLTVEGDVYIRSGKLISDGNYIECKSLSSTDEVESSRGLDIQNSNVTINGTEDELGFSLNIYLPDAYYDQGFDLLADGSTITFTDDAKVYITGLNKQDIEFNKIVFEQDAEFASWKVTGFTPYVEYLQFEQNGGVSGYNEFGTVELARGYDFEFEDGVTYEMDSLLAEGSCFAPISIHSSEDGTQTTISSANDVTGDFLELQDIAGDTSDGTTYTATNSFAISNVTGWTTDETIGSVSLYWVGKGDDDSWNNYENWSRSEDGSEEGCVPTLNDDVFFTSISFSDSKYVELLSDGKCHSMTWSDDVDPEANFSVYETLQMAGSMDLTENMTLSMSGTFEFVGDGLTDDKEVDFADKSMNGDIIFDGDDQSWIWTSSLTTTGDLYLESGSVSTEGNDFTIGRFSSPSLDDDSAVRKFDMSSSIVSVTSDETTGWNMIVNTTGGLEFIATDTGITFENGGGIYCETDTEVTFGFVDFMDNGVINIDGSGSGNFGSVAFYEQGQIYGDNTFTNLEFTLGYEDNTIESGKTITISGELTMEGVRCSYVFLHASTAGEAAYIYKPSGYFDGIYDASFTDIEGSSGSGGDHPVYYYYDDNDSSTGFYELDDTDEDGDGVTEEDAPSFESSFDQATEEYCSDVAYLDFVESFPINSSTTFIWYYSEDGTDGSYTEISGETSTTITVDTTGFYKVAVIYGLSSDDSGDICEIESVIEVILGAVSNVSLEITATNVTCYGLGDGRVVAQVEDTMYPDYTFFWKDEDGTSITSTTLATDGTSTASNLEPGKYYITVADSKSCEFDTTVNIFDAYELVLESIDTTNLTCYTIPEGEILVTASGGTGDLSYYLDGELQESDTISGLYAGEYLVYVQDENSCTTEVDTVEITSNPEIVLDLNGSDLLCNGDSNGEFDPIVTGGVPDYSYSWTGPDSFTSTNASISGLAGGTYELTVTDAVNCPSVSDTILLEPEELSISELIVDAADCNGESSGEIYVVATQGTPDYVYSIGDLDSDSGIFTDLASGDYTVQIVDANACEYDTLVTISEPGVIGFLVEDLVLPTCENTNDGIITITPYGGNSGYTFSWSGPDDYRSYSQNLENIAAGDYSLLISDLNNCSTEGEVDLNLGYTIQLGLVVEQDVTTSGGSDGILTIETTEGTTPYSFTVSGPDGYSYSSSSDYDNSSSTIENLAAGVYTVIATDVSGCSTVEKSIIIDEPGAMYVYIEEIQAVGCADSPVGELKAHASGGSDSYTYSWSSTSGYSGSGQTITGLSEGTYTVTATSGSESATDTYELLAPDALSVSVDSVVEVSCNNEADGEIELAIDAGSADYTIEWTSDDGFLSSAEHILDLEPGTYNYTVTTEYGCSTSGSVSITEPSSLDLSVTTVDISIAGERDGELTATVTGGTSPYIFLISGPNDYSYAESSNTSGTVSVSGLEMGFYEVVVLDANECRIEDSGKVYEPEILVLYASSITSVTCPGGSDGAITVDYMGQSDSTNVSFSWSGDNYFTSTDQNVSGLQAGDYTVTITDSEGDVGYESQSLEITVSEPDELVAEYWKEDITCYGLTDGYINLHPQGGTPSYTYSWTGTGVIADNEDQQGLSEGTYTIQITDSLGCVSETETISIEEPSQVIVTVSDYSEPSCYGFEDGWITLDISDGSGPYLINWDDYGSISEDIYEIESGEYSFVVTDKNGCEVVDTVVLNQPDSLIAEINDYQDVLCNGEETAYAIVDITGGTPDYTISWSDGQDTDEASNLGTGRYEVTVVDENACSDTASVEITQPDALVLKVEATRPTTIDAYDGSIRIDVSGGVEDYSIDWVDEDFNYYSGLTIEDLDADTYTVTVVDENGCELDSIIELEYLYETRIKIPKAFTPNGDSSNDYWDLERIEYIQDLEIVIYDRWGKVVYKFNGTGNEYRGDPWTGTDGNSDLPIGSYYYAVILNDEKPLMGTVTILR
jgi:gliding motility-associated-like protein